MSFGSLVGLGRSLLTSMMAIIPESTFQATFTFTADPEYDPVSGTTQGTVTTQTVTCLRKQDDDRRTKEDAVDEDISIIWVPKNILVQDPDNATIVTIAGTDYFVTDNRNDTAGIYFKLYLQAK